MQNNDGQLKTCVFQFPGFEGVGDDGGFKSGYCHLSVFKKAESVCKPLAYKIHNQSKYRN